MAFLSANIIVDDRLILPRRLINRLVTAVEWEKAPPAILSGATVNFVAVARALQSLTAERQVARLHVSVEWED
eukprot:3783974-Pleurochrysis_carterae.AAC.1